MSATLPLTPDNADIREIFAELGVGVLLQGPNAEILVANPAALTLLGLDEDQLLGKTSFDPAWNVVHEDGSDFPGPEHPVPQAIATGRAVRDVVMGVYRPRYRSRIWLIVDAIPELDGDGAVSRVLCTFRDYTAAKRRTDELGGRVRERSRELTETVARLERSQARLRRITDAIPGAVYEHVRDPDARDRLTFVSEGAEDLLGRSVEELLRRPSGFFEAIDPLHREAVGQSLDRSAEADEVWTQEFLYRLPSGDTRWLRGQAHPRREASGRVVFSGVLTDVTEQRAQKDAAHRSQKMEAVGALAAGVAHNFNNLLASILPNLDVGLELADGELEQALQDARRATVSAKEVVRQLLALTRKGEQVSATLPIHEPIEAALRVCRRTFDRKIELHIDSLPEDLWVRGRSAQLEQVVLNLLLNARDAAQHQARPRITISVESSPESPESQHGSVTITVSDNGHGIDEATAGRLWEPFFTTKAPGDGSGLGLASVYGIVRDHDGHVSVQSQPGEGAAFRVELPLVAGHMSMPPPTPIRSLPPSATEQARRVLLVDDERLVRRSYARLLTRMGFEAEEVPSGEAALTRLLDEGRPYDLVILDLSMPGVGGAETLARLRRSGFEAPVLILSGYADVQPPEGADGVLIKPATRADLHAAINALLAQ